MLVMLIKHDQTHEASGWKKWSFQATSYNMSQFYIQFHVSSLYLRKHALPQYWPNIQVAACFFPKQPAPSTSHVSWGSWSSCAKPWLWGDPLWFQISCSSLWQKPCDSAIASEFFCSVWNFGACLYPNSSQTSVKSCKIDKNYEESV